MCGDRVAVVYGFGVGVGMIIVYWLITMLLIGFILGMLSMFGLTRREKDIYRKREVELQNELKAYESICDE